MNEKILTNIFRVVLVVILLILWLVLCYIALIVDGPIVSILCSGIMAFGIGKNWEHVINDW